MSIPSKKNQKQIKREKAKKLKTAVMAVSAELRDSLFDILIGAERIEYGGAEVFLVNKEQIHALIELEKRGSKQMQRFDISEADADFTGKTFSIINKDRKSFAVDYKFYMRVTPLILTDEEKVRKRILSEMGIWANIQRKGLREALSSGEFSEDEANRMKRETEVLIEEETAKLREIIENFDEYEVVVTNYETSPAYPTIYYNDKQGKKHIKHLSIKMPNILWYEDKEHPREHRKDANIVQFIRSATKVANMVYFKPKASQ